MSVALRTDHLDFALRLGAELAGAGGSSLVWSPYSVACALGLVSTGARGATRAELCQLLGEDLEAHLVALDDAVAAGPELAASTGLWMREDLPVRPEFEATLRARPGAGVYTADFPGDPDGVRQTINAEVEKITHGLISGLLQPGDVPAATQAILVNALWVRLRWQAPFEVATTEPRDFHSPAGTRRVPTMHRRGRIPYGSAAGWRMVTLDADHDLALDVLLPDTTGVPPALTREALAALYRSASPTDVELSLPRFELTHRAKLAGALNGTGVRTVFTNQADLSGVSQRPLRIDQVVHQARLRVNEKGAEGAAATAVVMRTLAAVPSRPVVFAADRPFHLILRRRQAILFLGTVADPEDPGPGDD